jgi:V8-like Glu-specific endopeptidase
MNQARRTIRTAVGILGLTLLAWGASAPWAQAQVGHRLLPSEPLSNAELSDLMASATPMILTREGPGDLPAPLNIPVAPAAAEGPMRIHPGSPGQGLSGHRVQQEYTTPANGPGSAVEPLDYGSGNRNTIYHFSDYLLAPYPVSTYPYRAAGKLFFTLHGFDFVCSAALISRSIIVTAGHCVNDGDGTFASRAVFVPAYSESAPEDLFGRCSVTHIWTTPEWNSGLGLAFEHDVAVALCDRVEGRRVRDNPLIGDLTGWLGFCYRNCRMPFFMDTQIGYPVNYYGGGEMTISQHLAETVTGVIGGWPTGAYVHGSGMGGGASGGPHIMNSGAIDETATPSEFPDRNVTLAVSSFIINGAPGMMASVALTDANNSINFRRMYNLACRVSRRTLGRDSCERIL